MKTPEEWMRDFESKIADAKAKAAVFQEGLAHAGATATSQDGSVTVSVAPNGSLDNVTLTDAALRKSAAELSAEINTTARKAQRQAAVNVTEAFQEANGEDSETLHMLTGYLPPEVEEEQPPAPEQGYQFTQPAPPRPQTPPRRPTNPDDGDFGDDSIYGR